MRLNQKPTVSVALVVLLEYVYRSILSVQASIYTFRFFIYSNNKRLRRAAAASLGRANDLCATFASLVWLPARRRRKKKNKLCVRSAESVKTVSSLLGTLPLTFNRHTGCVTDTECDWLVCCHSNTLSMDINSEERAGRQSQFVWFMWILCEYNQLDVHNKCSNVSGSGLQSWRSCELWPARRWVSGHVHRLNKDFTDLDQECPVDLLLMVQSHTD